MTTTQRVRVGGAVALSAAVGIMLALLATELTVLGGEGLLFTHTDRLPLLLGALLLGGFASAPLARGEWSPLKPTGALVATSFPALLLAFLAAIPGGPSDAEDMMWSVALGWVYTFAGCVLALPFAAWLLRHVLPGASSTLGKREHA